MREDLVEAWSTNNRINLYLIEHISDEGMLCSLSTVPVTEGPIGILGLRCSGGEEEA